MHVMPAIRRQRREDVFAFWVYTCSRLANASYASPVNKKEEVECSGETSLQRTKIMALRAPGRVQTFWFLQ